MFALAVGEIMGNGDEEVALAGNSTLNRIEHCPETVTNRAESRITELGMIQKRLKSNSWNSF
jgi:hypothetical protein